MVKRKVRKAARRAVRAFRSIGAPRISKLSSYGFGHALGVVSVVVMLLYAVMTWFGDFNSSIITQQYPLVFSFSDWTILLGLVQTYVLSYIGGWIFVKVYNKVAK